VSCRGSTENDTSVRPGRSARISFMRAVIIGQMPPQRVKTNPATHGCPARSSRVTVRPDRSTSENAGTAPRTSGPLAP
jgi:hypothetical protein